MAKKATKTPNAQDSTLRNNRARKREIDDLRARLQHAEDVNRVRFELLQQRIGDLESAMAKMPAPAPTVLNG